MPQSKLTREQSQAQTRQKLLEAAMEVFAAHGYAEASMEKVAAAAGFSKGAVYSNFDGKEDLFLELKYRQMTVEIEQFARALTDIFSNTSDHGEMLDGVCRYIQSTYEDERNRPWCLLGIELQLHACRHPEFAARLAQRRKQHRAAIGGTITRLVMAFGKVPPSDPEAVASVLTGVVYGMFLEVNADPDKGDYSKLMSDMLAALFGIAPGRPDRN